MMIKNTVRNWRKRQNEMEGINPKAWVEAAENADFFESLQKNGDNYYTTDFGTTVERMARGYEANYQDEDFILTTTLGLHFLQTGSVSLSFFSDFLMETWENKYRA